MQETKLTSEASSLSVRRGSTEPYSLFFSRRLAFGSAGKRSIFASRKQKLFGGTAGNLGEGDMLRDWVCCLHTWQASSSVAHRLRLNVCRLRKDICCKLRRASRKLASLSSYSRPSQLRQSAAKIVSLHCSNPQLCLQATLRLLAGSRPAWSAAAVTCDGSLPCLPLVAEAGPHCCSWPQW